MMDELERMRRELARLHYDPRRLRNTVESAILQLYRAWDELDDATRQRLDRLRRELAAALADRAVSGQARNERMIAFLDALVADDAVLPLIVEPVRAGKAETPGPSGAGTSYLLATNLIRVLKDDPARYTPRSAAKGISTLVGPEPQPHGEREIAPPATVQALLEGVDVRFFTYIDFPPSITNDTTRKHPLIVQLVLNRPEESRVEGEVTISFEEPEQPELVDVIVRAPGFLEASGHGPGVASGPAWSRTIAVYHDRDSQPAVFLLQLADDRQGPRWLIVDFYHQGRNVGSFTVETTVSAFRSTRSRQRRSPDEAVENITLGGAQIVRAVDGLSLPGGDPPPPADVELRIIKDADGRTLHFTLRSAQIAYYQEKPAGSVVINNLQDPFAFLDPYIQRLNQFAAQALQDLDDERAADFEEEIADIGIELYDQLFPDDLKREYWNLKALREQGRLASLMIVSDEPWIPWELVKPYDVIEGEDVEDDHLAGAWRLSRWLAGRGPGAELDIHAARLVAPQLDLDFVQQERAYFDGLRRRHIRVPEPIRTHAEFMRIAREGGAQLVHFATHGSFDVQNVGQSPILLQDKSLIPMDINKRSARGLRRERPIVFLNTCHGGRMGFTLTGLGGWAERLVDQVGVTAFVGALWEVNDELASIFAQAFYEGLWNGKPLGEAFHDARLKIRAIQPANPTWIAYTLYGDPNSRIHWTGASTAETVEGAPAP